MNKQEVFASKLLQINAIKLSPQNPFTWASGLLSPIYCDNRIVLSYPEIRSEFVEGLVDLAKALEPFDMVSGVATAGIPIGALVADRLSLPFIYVRGSAKKHGRKNQIEGDISQGKKVLVVEDLISTGGSSIEAVHILREAGLEVAGVIANFQYGMPVAKANFEKAGCDFQTLSNYNTLIQLAHRDKMITEEELNMLKEWQADPENWRSNAFRV